MGQIPNLEKLMAFCWLVIAPLLLHIDKRAVSLQVFPVFAGVILSYSGPGWSGHHFSAGAEVFLTVAVI